LITAGTAKRTLAIFALSISSLLIWVSAAAAAPANDAFADASPLAASPGTVNGSNVEATKQLGEPDHAGNPGGHSVWYSWTPGADQLVGIASGSCFSSVDALIAVYIGPGLGSLSPVASNASPFGANCIVESPQAEFEALAGTTYWIAVDGRDGAQGSFQLQFNGPPSNDDFDDAPSLGAQPPQAVFGSNRLSGKEVGEPDHAGDPGGHSVWFAWTPTSSEPVKIYTCSSFNNFDSVLSVYTGSAVDALTEVASNDEAPSPFWAPACASANSEVEIDAVADTTYKIAVDGADGALGKFNLRIEGRPANDDFADAQEILPGPFSPGNASGTTKFATEESGEPDHAGSPGGHSVWYSWTPTAGGPVRISTCGAEGPMDTLLAVYTGSSLAAASLAAANDNGQLPRCGDVGSELELDAVAGTTYRIAVDGKDGSQQRFQLNIEAPPANDDFAAAKGLPGLASISESGNNALASSEAGEQKHAASSGNGSVWFSWVAPETGSVVVSVCPYLESSPDTLLAVYTGDSLGSLTPIAANDDSPAACQEVGSEVTLDAVAGTTYRIAVDSKGVSGGIFSIDIEGRPANDDFSAARVVGPGPALSGGSTLFAGKQSGEPDHAGDPGGHSVWFSWTPTQSGPVDIKTCARPGVDTLLAVYTGSAVGALTQVAANDDVGGTALNEFCEAADTDSEVTFEATVGTTYRIAVDSKESEGRFGLIFQESPQNDDFANASELYPGLPAYGSVTNKLASGESGEPDHAGASPGHSLWFSWTAASSGPIAIGTCTQSGDLDTVLGVYTGEELTGLSEVASDDDGQSRRGCDATDSAVEFTAVAGTTYEIAVDGKGGSVGSSQLIVEGTAFNDDFGRALPLGGGLPVTWGTLSNRFARKQVGEPDHAGDAGGSSIWFKWTAPRSGAVSIDTCDADFDTLLAVYTGGALGFLTPVASNDDGGGSCSPGSKLSFDAAANATYRIAVDGGSGAQGTFALSIDERPANDDFEAAESIPGTPGWYWPGATKLATKQSGEPDHGGDPGGHSVWFSWTPKKSWEIELDACASGFDPRIGVYTGDALASLAPVDVADAGSGDCDEGRSVSFTTVAGETYRIAVDGAGGDEGRFQLHLKAASVLPYTLSIQRTGAGSGTVDASVAGLDCGTICSHDYEDGTAMVLIATPVAGSTFAGWSGGGCSGAGRCQIAINADTQVTATFEAPPSAGGGGTVPPVVTPPATAPPASAPPKKPFKCKRGFRKKIVHGKRRCVKKKHTKHRRHHG
jgi:hypothetical protein